MNFSLFLLAVFVVAQILAESDENSAKLLLYKVTQRASALVHHTTLIYYQLHDFLSLKSTSTDAVVEGRDFLVTYQIINVGNAAATGIEVVDRYDATRLAAVACKGCIADSFFLPAYFAQPYYFQF
jgi:hypothetical protein